MTPLQNRVVPEDRLGRRQQRDVVWFNARSEVVQPYLFEAIESATRGDHDRARADIAPARAIVVLPVQYDPYPQNHLALNRLRPCAALQEYRDTCDDIRTRRGGRD